MAFSCGVDGCAMSYPDVKTLKLHRQRVHLGYLYYCERCGHGPVSASGTLSDHRGTNLDCHGPVLCSCVQIRTFSSAESHLSLVLVICQKCWCASSVPRVVGRLVS